MSAALRVAVVLLLVDVVLLFVPGLHGGLTSRVMRCLINPVGISVMVGMLPLEATRGCGGRRCSVQKTAI
ncbi:hypothetical protein LPH55_01195 [Xylella taiwanensis]|uniref:Uncharacterized protein n=1 Tax=Xylella taiwanensis TaxID=1444770 RepID=A0ABS8TUE2_9GAMM|nr:hypothetical protein [Xylella taiwanensis]MCD8459293.1 hypothetical protein [Xylella taiwanensis]MCD8468899.1 hypothetical protein [Xylella taiwanensis]MCD8472119.1 hypothetical protein [Xylella taiwanensis]